MWRKTLSVLLLSIFFHLFAVEQVPVDASYNRVRDLENKEAASMAVPSPENASQPLEASLVSANIPPVLWRKCRSWNSLDNLGRSLRNIGNFKIVPQGTIPEFYVKNPNRIYLYSDPIPKPAEGKILCEIIPLPEKKPAAGDEKLILPEAEIEPPSIDELIGKEPDRSFLGKCTDATIEFCSDFKDTIQSRVQEINSSISQFGQTLFKTGINLYIDIRWNFRRYKMDFVYHRERVPHRF